MSSVSEMSDTNSEPLAPPDSPGSSVSSRFQEEYDELLRYAVVVPTYDPRQLPPTLPSPRGSFLARLTQEQQNEDADDTLQDDVETIGEEEEEEESNYDHSESEIKHGIRTLKSELYQSTPLEGTPNVSLQRAVPQNENRLFESENDDFRSAIRLEEDVVYDGGVDPDVNRVEGLLDTWTTDLKRNIMAEFSRSRVKSIEQHRTDLKRENEKHAAEVNQLQNEIESMKELLHTYEKSITRKDQVIANLTNGLQRQKEKLELSRTFAEWKVKHNDVQREQFESKLAQKRYDQKLKRKMWDAWHSVLENNWKQRVEKACQSKASEVCMQLTNDYESRIASLDEALECARAEVARLHQERDKYEETMKKAFMRGVCALNLEAMSMFHDQESKDSTGRHHTDQSDDDEDPFSGQGAAHMLSQEAVFNNEPPGAPLPRVVSIQPPAGRSVQQKPGYKNTAGKSTKVTAKVTARTDSGLGSRRGHGAAAPMSSVSVERHPPVNKETLGPAIASQYAKYPQPVIVQRKIAGQGPGNIPMATPNIQNVKVVE